MPDTGLSSSSLQLNIQTLVTNMSNTIDKYFIAFIFFYVLNYFDKGKVNIKYEWQTSDAELTQL